MTGPLASLGAAPVPAPRSAAAATATAASATADFSAAHAEAGLPAPAAAPAAPAVPEGEAPRRARLQEGDLDPLPAEELSDVDPQADGLLAVPGLLAAPAAVGRDPVQSGAAASIPAHSAPVPARSATMAAGTPPADDATAAEGMASVGAEEADAPPAPSVTPADVPETGGVPAAAAKAQEAGSFQAPPVRPASLRPTEADVAEAPQATDDPASSRAPEALAAAPAARPRQAPAAAAIAGAPRMDLAERLSEPASRTPAESEPAPDDGPYRETRGEAVPDAPVRRTAQAAPASGDANPTPQLRPDAETGAADSPPATAEEADPMRLGAAGPDLSGASGPQVRGGHAMAHAPLFHAAEERAPAEQLAAAISRRDDGDIELRLDPPELGRVRVVLGAGEHGLTATITTERPDVADLMRRHADVLERALADAGHKGAALSFGSEAGGGQERRAAADAGGRQGGLDVKAGSPPPVPVRRASGGIDIRV